MIFARLVTAEFQVDKTDEVIRIFQENIVPSIKSQEGYRGGYLLTDRKTGKGAVLALWDTEENITANTESGLYQEQVSMVAPFLATAPAQGVYEVAVQD